MLFKQFCRTSAIAIALAAMPFSAQAETLREALATAYTNNPNILSALLDVKSSAEDIALRKAGKRPTIALSGAVNDSFTIASGNFSNSTSANIGLGYNQTLFDNLRTDAQIEQARALSELSAQALRNAEQNVLLSVVDSYVSIIRDTQLVQLRADNVSFYQAQVGSANERLRIGEGTRIDVSQADARLAQAVASYQSAITSLQSSQASYQRWVGRAPKNLSQDYGFRGLIPATVDDALASADARHPAIMSARAAIRASQAGSDAAQAAFGPTLDLIGQIGASSTFGSTNSSGSSAFSGSVRMSLSIPLYAGGALGASVRKANLEQMRSEVDAMATRDQVREAVVTSWSTLQNAAAQIESAQAAVESGNLVLQGIIQERDVGQRTTLDVLNAQSELTSAREGLIGATSTRIIASFSLLSAMGRLSAEDLKLPVQIQSADGYTATVEDVWQELRAIAE